MKKMTERPMIMMATLHNERNWQHWGGTGSATVGLLIPMRFARVTCSSERQRPRGRDDIITTDECDILYSLLSGRNTDASCSAE